MPDLDARQLRYFVTTAETGSMSQAARQLYVSQQALSKSITALETTLGAALFVREKSGVVLTDFGQFFLKRARLSLETFDFAAGSLRDFSSGINRTISLGMPPRCLTDFGGTLSPARLYALQKAYPHVQFEFVEADERELAQRLEDGDLQFVIGEQRDDEAYRGVLLGDFPLVVIVSRDNPLSRRAQLAPQDLASGQIVTGPEDGGLERLVNELARRTATELRTSPIKVSSVDPSDLIVDRDLFSVCPEQHAMRTASTERVALVPLVDEHGKRVSVALSLFWRANLPLQAPERALINYISALYAHREEDEV